MISAVIKFVDKKIFIHSEQVEKVDKIFLKGVYDCTTDDRGQVHIQEEEVPEVHEPFKNKENNLIISTFDKFFQEGVREKTHSLDYIHKLGILLYGKPGVAKTSLMNFLAKRAIINDEAIVFICNSSNQLSTAIGLSKQIREIQNNPIIFIADEFERYAQNIESSIKNFLDGVDSVDNMVFLAATNYIEQVPKTLSERPSRFKIVQEIPGITDLEEVKVILSFISEKIQPNLFTEEEIDQISNRIINEEKETTLDSLKHVCLDKITGITIHNSKKSIGFFNKEEEKEEEINWWDSLVETQSKNTWTLTRNSTEKINKDSNI